MSAAIERIRSSVDSLNRVHANGEYATSCAIGVWTDDPKYPGVTAVVFQGRLYELIIPDDYKKKMPTQDLDDLVGAVVLNAFLEWEVDRKRLMSAKSHTS